MRSRRWWGAGLAAAAGMIAGGLLLAGWPAAKADSGATAAGYRPHKAGTLTFNKEIAPIIFGNCSSCHRPGEVAPFSLLSYGDVKKRAPQIALVAERRIMPPWKADSHGEFLDERRLTTEQIGMLRQWADDGAKEGSAKDSPQPPQL